MTKLLLLYDLKEKDLARDVSELLKEMGIDEIFMIPLSPNLGLSLVEKEGHYIKSCDGAIFIVTPGAARSGQDYPSPSVSVEIGQINERFKTQPERIIYLWEEGCAPPTIHQKAFINFNRSNIRSIIEAITILYKDLKIAGLLTNSKLSKKFDSNWSKNYDEIMIRAYAQFPGLALKREDEIEISAYCSTHLNDLKHKETYGSYSQRYLYCELCKDKNGDFRKISSEKFREIIQQAISEYRKWLEENMKKNP